MPQPLSIERLGIGKQSPDQRERVVFFECLATWHYPIVTWYLCRGYAVYYKHLQAGCRPDGWCSWLGARKTIRRVTFDPPLYRWMNSSYDDAFAHVEEVYERHYANHRAIQHLGRLFQSHDVHLAFKKVLVERLSEYFYYRLLIERVRERFAAAGTLHLILSNPRYLHQQRTFSRVVRPTGVRGKPLCPEWAFPLWARVAGGWSSIGERLETILFALRVLGRCAHSRLHRSTEAGGGVYDYGIAIISPLRELHEGLRSAGFLIDGRIIKKEQTLLIPLTRLSPDRIAWLKGQGLQVSGYGLPVSWKTFAQTLSIAVRLLGWLLFHLRAPLWVLETAATLLREFVIWTPFTAAYRVGILVTCGDFQIGHIPRNILLRQQGTTIWYYMDSSNMGGMAMLHGRPQRWDCWGYLSYDVMVCWNERLIRYFQMHHQQVGRYLSVGCLWSEHIRLLRDGAIPSTFPQLLREHGWKPGQKILSVFPTWYHVNSLTAPEDGLEFIRRIEQLLAEFPDLFVVLKEKHARWLFVNRHDFRREDFGGEGALTIYRAYEALERHPRCWLPGHTANTSELIAFSDLVVSFPFASPTVEAMGARLKGLYYDPYGKYRGGPYDQIPGLVAHDYQELRRRVASLVYDTTPEDYAAYLQRYAHDEIPFLDGRGLTRFRERLAGRPEDEPIDAAHSSPVAVHGS